MYKRQHIRVYENSRIKIVLISKAADINPVETALDTDQEIPKISNEPDPDSIFNAIN